MDAKLEHVKPADLFDLVRVERLNDLDRAVFDAALLYASKDEPGCVGIKTSDNWTIRIFGAHRNSSYFAFSGCQGGIHFGVLSKVRDDDLLKVAREEDYLALIAEAGTHPKVSASIPLKWAYARHTNQGLYEEAAQFEIEPPCLLLSGYCSPEEITDVVNHLTESRRRFDELLQKRARGE